MERLLEQDKQNKEAVRAAMDEQTMGGGSPDGQPSGAAKSLDDLLNYVTQQGVLFSARTMHSSFRVSQ